MSKQEATRLADALRRCAPVDFDGDFAAAAALLERWPDGAPVAVVESWTSGSYSRNYKLQWFKDVPRGAKLYTAPPAKPDGEPTPIDAIYAAWHGAGVDIAGGNWSRFVSMLPPTLFTPPDAAARIAELEATLKVAGEALEALMDPATNEDSQWYRDARDKARAALRAIKEVR